MNSSTNSLDDVSADSSAEFPDRASMMEVRLQAQEDEITLLKSSLADALRRIRLHDQLLPLLKQQLIAVNPGAARVLNQVCCPDGCTSSRKLSSSSAIDGIHHSTTSSQLSGSIVTNTNGHIGSPASTKPRPVSVDRSTQTESVLQGGEAGQDKVPLHCRVQSLNLEDALPPGHPVEATRAKLHRVPGMEEEDEEEDDEVGGEQEKELSWTSSVEEPIQPTTIRGLQREESHDGNCSPEEVVGSPSASLRASDQNLNSRCGPLSPIQEGLKTPLCVSSPHHQCRLHNQLLSCD